MAGRSPEARPVIVRQQEPAPQVQDVQPAPQDQEPVGKSKTERGARFYRNFNVVTGAGWATAGVIASGGLAAVAFGMAAFDGAQAAISHKVAKDQENKRLEKQATIDAQNGQNMSNIDGQPGNPNNIDVSPRGEKFQLRTRREGQFMDSRQSGGTVVELNRKRPARQNVVFNAKAA